MAQTFFKMLTEVERFVNDKSSKDVKEETKGIVNALLSFIESGIYIDSKVEKFIASNFRLGATKITEKWNATHLSKQKKVNTFCGQISLLSSYISSIFGYSPDEIYNAVTTNNLEVLNHIYSIISAYEVSEVDISDRFKVLKCYLPEVTDVKEYSFSECQKEFEILKTFDDEVISKQLEEVDFDKLIYLINLCKKPLISDEYIELTDKKKKIKVARVNEDKLEFCKVLKATKPIKLKPKKEISVDMQQCKQDELIGTSQEVTKEYTETKYQYIQEPSEIPYNLDVNKDIADVITSYIEKYRKYAEVNKGMDKYLLSANEDTHIKAEVFLKSLTVEGTLLRLQKINPYSLDEVIKNEYLKKVE